MRYLSLFIESTTFDCSKLVLWLLSVVLSASCANRQPLEIPEPSPSPLLIGGLAVNQLVANKNYMMYEGEAFTGFHYAEVAAAYGAYKLVALSRDRDHKIALNQRYQNPPATKNLLEEQHVDASVYGVLPLQMFLSNNDPGKLEEGLKYADAQWQNPNSDGSSQQTRYWIDDIWMINILQIQAYRASKNPVYLDRAALQTELYINKLQKTNGLFFHGDQAPFYWGRGNGWVAAGLAELISVLPAKHPKYKTMVNAYKKMMAALLAHQAESGMWRQLLDKPESWEESSATAMFGYAMVLGVKTEILKAKIYRPAYLRAWTALSKRVDTSGNLEDICVGTAKSKDIDFYLKRPRRAGDLHGQAPLLWFAAALL